MQFNGFAGPQRPTVSSVSTFANGFMHQLDAEFDPFGNLLVMDYGGYSGPSDNAIVRIAPGDAQCIGDIDGDRAGTSSDIASLLVHFGQTGCATRANDDRDADGDVDLVNLRRQRTHYGERCV